MTVLVLALLLSYGIEAFVLWRYWQTRRITIPVVAMLAVFATAGTVFWQPSVAAVFLLITAGYRFFNHLILADGRSNESYIQGRGKRTMVIMGATQLAGMAWWLWQSEQAWVVTLPYAAVVGASLAGAMGSAVAWSAYRARQTTQVPVIVADHPHTKALPAVTLAIPARNETEVLERCLRAAIASDYPKLEILVLDDCSQDATADIIKSFAHDGVRFIQGEPVPSEHWVHKNYASQQLLDHASGSVIMMMGVDVELAPKTISQLVALLRQQKRDMITVVPARPEALGASWLQTIRYWWELALPRDILRRPPALSSCWIARTEAIKSLGGYQAASRMIVPEAFFARELQRNNAYMMVRGKSVLDVASRKTASEQRSTAVRVRYPQIRRRPEWVLWSGLLWLVQWPVVAAGWWLATGSARWYIGILAGIGWLGYIASYSLIATLYAPRQWWHTLLLGPCLPLLDVITIHVSMYQYEFGNIEWKGRNVCLPAMQVFKSLPPLPPEQPTA